METEDFWISREDRFDGNTKKYRDAMQKYIASGTIRSGFDDPEWMCDSDVKGFGLNFLFSGPAYMTHGAKFLDVTPSDVQALLKCYTLYCFGGYILLTMQRRLNGLKAFLCRYGEPDYIADFKDVPAIEEFLSFAGLSDLSVNRIKRSMKTTKPGRKTQRELANFINYLAIDAEITDMYSKPMEIDEFVRWFPILFWCKVTFVLPLRATEMLLTPFDCIEEKNGKTYLSVRRTLLKKGKRKVDYDVDKDYRIFRYEIPSDSPIIPAIRKYQEYTAGHKRRFLFDYDEAVTEAGKLSLGAFNHRLEDFVSLHIIGNWKYDYARFASGIEEFEVVSAGDSRPIAMANLYFQDAGADICRQLADHEVLTTSYNYYTNVSNTVFASSVMTLQRRINAGRTDIDDFEKIYGKIIVQDDPARQCLSPKRVVNQGDISDCVLEDHLHECIGCRYYAPTEKELQTALAERRNALDEASKNLVKCVSSGFDINKDDFDKVFLDAHTGITRYKTACDEEAKEKLKVWRRLQNTKTVDCSKQ